MHTISLRLILGCLLISPALGFAGTDLLFDGNSWVAGSGATAGSNFPNQVQARLQKAGTKVKLLNTGVPGITIDRLQAKAASQVDPQAKQYPYFIGLEVVNQWGNSDQSRDEIYAKYKQYFLDRKAAGFRHVLALTPIGQGYYPRKNWEADRQWFIAKMLEEFPKLGIAVANVGGDPRLTDWKNTTYYCPDKIHPNNAGYDVMAEIVAKAILNPTQPRPIGVPARD